MVCSKPPVRIEKYDCLDITWALSITIDDVSTTIPKATTTTFLLGVATVIAQSILLREAMAAMGGSEVALGLVMALWLSGMSLGARLGVRIGSPALAGLLPLLTLVAAAVGTVLFRAAPELTGATAGTSQGFEPLLFLFDYFCHVVTRLLYSSVLLI